MLIESNAVLQPQKTLTSVETNEGNLKIQERIQKVKNEEENGKSERRCQDDKHSCQQSERKSGKTSPFSDITEVTSYLYLCGAIALRSNTLQDLGITCVINASKELPDTPLPDSSEKDTLYLRVNVDDKVESNILPWLNLISDVIQQVKRAGGKTLIHCVAGVSRSATLCLAYLIKYERYTLRDSYFTLKSLRPSIRPNSGFFKQLIAFEKELTGNETVSFVYSEVTNSYIPQIYEEDYRRCKSSELCRRFLF